MSASSEMATMQQEELVGQVLQGTYRVERELGAGGMGVVYEAAHVRLARRFAIKLLYPNVAAHPEALARFRREAEVTSSIGHPHIVEVVDFNQTDGGSPYIVMELLQGEDLDTRMQRVGRFELPAALSVFYQTASGLAAAHERGVIHRDLKPPNLFLARLGGRDDWVKIVDFGISKVLGSRSVVTRTHTTMGTPSYMAPEQAEGRAAAVDARSDIFALGTILYEMISGRPPFTGESIPTVLYKVVHHDPPSLSSLRSDLPPQLALAVGRALAKSPGDRFQSMGEFAAAVRAAVPDVADTSLANISNSSSASTAPGLGPGAPTGEQGTVSGKRAAPKNTTLSGSAGQLESTLAPPRNRSALWIALGLLLIGGGSGVGWWFARGGGDKSASAAGSAAAGSGLATGSAAGSGSGSANAKLAVAPARGGSGGSGASEASSGSARGSGSRGSTSRGSGSSASPSRGTGSGASAKATHASGVRPSKAAQPKRVVLSVPLAGVRCVASFDGGKSAARGPCTLKVPRGYVQLTVTRAGYASYKQRVLVVEQRTVHRVALDRRTKRIVTPAQLAASRRKTKPIKASGGRKPPATKKPTSPSYWP